LKKLLSVTLSVVLAATTVLGAGVSVFATDAGNMTATKGVYWYETHEAPSDLTDTFIYDDELLKGDSLKYDQKLATMTFELAVASESSLRVDYPQRSLNLRTYLEDNGFTDFDTNEDYKEKMTTETMGVACAHKKIVDGGKTYALLAIVPRSAGYEAEWGGNFEMGEEGDHQGFKKGRTKVLNFAKEYIQKYGIKGDIKVWTAGYSRGAGVTNQVGAALLSKPKEVLGDSINLTPGNVYCYTFGTPKSAAYPGAEFGDYDASKFKYIHNTFETYDIVTVAPPAGFGFNRYGSDSGWAHYTYADKGDKERMLWFLEQTNPYVYEKYMNGGDPDGFKPKTLKYSLIDSQHKIEIIDAGEQEYMPKNQREFMAMMEESIAMAVELDSAVSDGSARDKYATGGYQDAMKNFAGYYFANTDKGGSIVEGIEGSKYAKFLAASMYISYMLEQYKDEIVARDNEQLQVLQDALNKLVEAAGGHEGQLPDDAPDDVKAAYNSIKTEIDSTEAADTRWTNIATYSRALTTALFRNVLKEGLDHAGVEDSALIRNIVADTVEGKAQARALSRILSYMLLYDTRQTEKTMSFTTVTQQVMHMATFMGNAESFMRPHNNEIILSWLRTLDSNYDDFVKENNAQISGYRRAYISQPEGIDVYGQVKDENGGVVAEFKNGAITSRMDSWIGITTSDNGNWLRIPADKKYFIDINVSGETSLDLKMTEWRIYDGKEVRTETSDSRYNWKSLKMKPGRKVRWVFEAVPAGSGGKYELPSTADYYIQYVATITYDLNGGTMWEQTGTVSKDYEVGETIKMPKPERKGYTFKYWKGSKYEAGESYTVTDDHTFTAVWEKGSGAANTGDHTDITMWALVLAASVLATALMMIIRVRRRV